MPPTHHVCGYVPPDSPLRALAGSVVRLPARGLHQLVERVRELRQAGVQPVVLAAPRPVPWTAITWSLVGGVLASLVAAIAAILTHHTTSAWIAAGAMVLCGVALFPALTHLEMDR